MYPNVSVLNLHCISRNSYLLQIVHDAAASRCDQHIVAGITLSVGAPPIHVGPCQLPSRCESEMVSPVRMRARHDADDLLDTRSQSDPNSIVPDSEPDRASSPPIGPPQAKRVKRRQAVEDGGEEDGHAADTGLQRKGKGKAMAMESGMWTGFCQT